MAREAEELARQGARIAELRGKMRRDDGSRLAQPDVADAVGVSLRAYQVWEAGAGDIDPKNRKALAAFFETTEDYIEYGRDQSEKTETPDPFAKGDDTDLAKQNSWLVSPFDSYKQLGCFSRQLTSHRRLLRQSSRLKAHSRRDVPQGLGFRVGHTSVSCLASSGPQSAPLKRGLAKSSVRSPVDTDEWRVH